MTPMSYLQTIRQPAFARLWVSQILSQVAQNLLNFALIINVFNAAAGTHYANVAVSLLVLAFGVPSIFFAAFAGAVVDRWNRRLVMLGSNILRGALVLLYIPFHSSLITILLLSFVISSITQFFLPAESAMIPQVVSKKSLLTANSLFVFSIYASFIVGYAVAAPVIATLGEMGPYLVTGGMFALAAVSLLGLPRDRGGNKGAGIKSGIGFWEEAREAFTLIRSDRWLSLAIRQLTITQAIVCVILTLAPALALSLLHRPLQQASAYLIVPAGLGMVFGVVLVGGLVRRWSKIRVLEIGLIIAGAALTLLGLSGLLYRPHHGHYVVPGAEVGLIVAALVFALGMLNAIISTTAQTVLQENSHENIRGKVFGSLNMFINMAGTLPILVTGILADLISVTTVITLMGAGVVVFAIVQLVQLRLHDRRHKQTAQ